MAISEARKRQFIVFSIVVYGLTIYSVYKSTKTSISFLQTLIRLTEGFNVVILTVFATLNSVLIWKLSTSLLFGDLRLIEYEHIFERLPFTIINTMLMSSMFNEQDFLTVAIFGLLLLYMKVFHWILRDRLEALLQTIQDSTRLSDLILTRFTCNLVLLGVADYQIISHCVTNSLANSFGASASVHLMMGMEFAILTIDLLNTTLHAALSFYELYQSQTHGGHNVVDNDDDNDADDSQFSGLEGKFIYERVIDITTRFLKTILHALLLIPLRMPIMLIKDVLWDCLSLHQNAKGLWKIWRNNKQLDDKLPTMSEDQLRNTDNMCIICMDELIPEQEAGHGSNTTKNKPKRLPCGHVLHLYCLKNWMERSQTCPICRLAVFDELGNVVQSTSSAPASAAEVASQTGGAIEAVNGVETVAERSQEQEQQQAGENNQGQTGLDDRVAFQGGLNSWYSFPVEETSDNLVTFSMKNSATEESVPASLLIERKNAGSSGGDDGDDEVEMIVIPDEAVDHAQTLENLKRRVSELESQVEHLNKRVRKD